MAELLGAQILEELESSKTPLSVSYMCRKCKKPETQIEEILENLKSIGLINSNSQGLWFSCSINDTGDDLSLDAERFDDSLPGPVVIQKQKETFLKEAPEPETELKALHQARTSPSDSSSSTSPKVPNNSASNAEYNSSITSSPLRAAYNVSQASDATNPKVTSRERSGANCSSTPFIQEAEEVTLSGLEDEALSRRLEATSLKEPGNQFIIYSSYIFQCLHVLQSPSDGALIPCKGRQPVIPRQNSDQTVSMVVGGGQIETSSSVQSWQLSRIDPAVKQHKDIIVSIIQYFQSTPSNGEKPLDVAKKCIGKNASKRGINRYLHSLNKEGVLQVVYQNQQKKSDPRWRATQKIHDVSDEKLEEIAAEFCTSKNSRSDQLARLPSNDEWARNSSTCNPGCLHLHQHHHLHQHQHNYNVQVGDGNTMHVNVPDLEREKEKETEEEIYNRQGE
ncbi:uncharacterized protein LOC134255801 [Saccostrea cucullata]|uniref:uncharacterized protein LOC134255801 n=1 Tax=Saccostrea cuccullata TaxID=36930 RepID=UPI002ED21205